MSGRPSLLILSFSPIAGDARVLKQVNRFTENYDVTTCGYGPEPGGVVEHIEVPPSERYDDLNGRLITLRLYARAYWSLSAVRWARRHLSGRRFDVILANDVEAVPLAVSLRPSHGVLADLHEYSPRLHENHELWRRRIGPWFDWLVRRYVTKAASWSTVSGTIAAEYQTNFGFRPELVSNAAPFHELEPGPVGRPIKIVHSGACLRNRQLHLMAEAVETATNEVTLDFFLTPNDPVYLEELREFASRSKRVVVHDPVPYPDLIETLNHYDVGIFVLPPINFNYEAALPNKIFDYLQARIAVLVGPSLEMREYVETYDLGIVSDDFTVAATRAAIERLTPTSVTGFKAKAHAAAFELSADHQVDIWERMLATQVTGVPR